MWVAGLSSGMVCFSFAMIFLSLPYSSLFSVWHSFVVPLEHTLAFPFFSPISQMSIMLQNNLIYHHFFYPENILRSQLIKGNNYASLLFSFFIFSFFYLVLLHSHTDLTNSDRYSDHFSKKLNRAKFALARTDSVRSVSQSLKGKPPYRRAVSVPLHLITVGVNPPKRKYMRLETLHYIHWNTHI